ncbi:aldo/keto reductase [Saccharospirillum salsuginis]|uniref:Aryl-alcohol dehydrogenase n=1 Tax=Saccharospirillum salsuginis TaxID=418750 RepID=A0A918NHN7_9GAMM|nr:aldo/keto reductase [Saccharospirillum salsuginis]GGX71207.1 aryl-alcohol dehydrogenase [Saccharospirillum salsuginis]
MQKLTLPNSDVQLSRLVYGVWRLADDSDTSVDHVRRKIDVCLDQGITSFDHADIYGNYECEAVFGQALKADPALRDRMELISKCDIALNTDKFPERKVKYYDTSAAYIQNSVENSLRHLHTDHLDLLLIHRPDPFMDPQETGPALDALIDSGKVRAVGVSNFDAPDWRLLQSCMSHSLVTNQIEMSVLERSAFTNGTLSDMRLDLLQPMAWSPLAGGQLFDNDSAAAMRVRPLLEQLAANHEHRVDLAAFAWLLAHPAGIVPVVGTNNLKRIEGLAGALDITVSREQWYEIWTAAAGEEVP